MHNAKKIVFLNFLKSNLIWMPSLYLPLLARRVFPAMLAPLSFAIWSQENSRSPWTSVHSGDSWCHGSFCYTMLIKHCPSELVPTLYFPSLIFAEASREQPSTRWSLSTTPKCLTLKRYIQMSFHSLLPKTPATLFTCPSPLFSVENYSIIGTSCSLFLLCKEIQYFSLGCFL